MTPVPPPSLPTAGQAGAARPDPARAAAQRAFFQAALGAPGAPQAAAPTAASPPAVFAQPVQRLPDPAAEPPTKILRPGSLLDIRV